ncbi:MAG: protein-L-isoaspartate(D-aspartate) O-methyltransferase [Pirellulaceae bacterium]
MKPFQTQRQELVEQLRKQGIQQERVLEAIGAVQREAFVPWDAKDLAYQNSPVPIANEQTISQPYIVALMAEALNLQAADRVLDIGTGSGYAAAILSRLCSAVYTVERFKDLAESAERRLIDGGFNNVFVRHGDGTQGWPEHAPFDAIAVAAGTPNAPTPLLDQLAIGGRMVIPIGQRDSQKLVLITKQSEDHFEKRNICGVRFVPLVDESSS